LARVNASLLPVQVALAEAGIPSSTPIGPKVLQRTGTRTALAYLRIGLAPHQINREDIALTVRRPSRGIAPNVITMLTEPRLTSVADIRRLASRLSGRDVAKLLEYADALESIVESCQGSATAALQAIRVRVGLGDTMDVLDGARREADRSTHADDLLALESVATLHPEVATFETWLRSVLDRPAPPGPAVLLSTIHKIKGREWDRVVIYGASEGLLPHRLSDDEEGERRVFHVALTRAIRQVLVLADAAAPSPFVAELDGTRPRTPLAPARTGRGPEVSAGPERMRRTSRPVAVLPSIAASVGLMIEYGGHAGAVVTLNDAAAVIRVGTAQLRVPFGSDVRVHGRTLVLDPPDGASPSPAIIEACEVALREWRSEMAKSAGVPAYVVLNDNELLGIAARRPSTLPELARCKGMGPIRLERWGDQLLAALDAVEAD
jgi:DNA helicase-2/ATP-dependent DNA helicase PcrA